MRNDNENWTPPQTSDAILSVDGFHLERIKLPRQTILSGPAVLNRFQGTLGPAIGWPDIAMAASYTVALRRDRLLMVNGPDFADGWDDTAQLAVSDMTGGFAVFELFGERVFDVLKRGADLNVLHSSRSAVRMFGGFGTILYRFQDQNRLRLHVNVTQEEAILMTLSHYLQRLER